METASETTPLVEVPKNLDGCHPLVAATLHALEKAKLNANGALFSTSITPHSSIDKCDAMLGGRNTRP